MESKLSELQLTESKLSVAMKNIESQLSEYNKSVLSVLSSHTEISESAMSEPAENISKSINEISNKLDQFSTSYSAILSKFDKMDASSPSLNSGKANSNVSSIVSTYINEEKEKSKRKLNLIVHNLAESSKDDGAARKQDDITSVLKICQQYMGMSVKIERAFRLGKHGEKPRLLKISVTSEQEKIAILQNCTKLRNENNPDDVKKLFVTPDLTPAEQAENKKLREELKRKNQNGNFFRIKRGRIIRRN